MKDEGDLEILFKQPVKKNIPKDHRLNDSTVTRPTLGFSDL